MKIPERKKRQEWSHFTTRAKKVYTPWSRWLVPTSASIKHRVDPWCCGTFLTLPPLMPTPFLGVSTLKSRVVSPRCVFVNEFSQELFTSHMRSWLECCCNCKPNHWSNGKVYDDKCHNSATGKKKAEGLTKEMEVSDVSEQSTICGKSTCVQWLELETEAAI